MPAELNNDGRAMPGGGAPPARRAINTRARVAAFFDQASSDHGIREVYDTVNRNNTSIYAVDPRGLAVFEYDINQGVGLQTDRLDLNASLDSLHVLANNTDGRAIVNRNDLAAGMKQIMRDASGYYLLGYTSAAAPTDGRFHTIDVRVKRPNVEVRSRKGYWAYTNEDAARASTPAKAGPPPEVSKALNAIAEPARADTRTVSTGPTSAGRQDARDVSVGPLTSQRAGPPRGRAGARLLTVTAPEAVRFPRAGWADVGPLSTAPAVPPAAGAPAEGQRTFTGRPGTRDEHGRGTRAR